ncbi:acyl-CoA thioesterase domain-containing protein [Nocardia takedensis]|uniref:acyl-CoA thioesterase domain-containing protein n=1 Tax=Nocardia takedensis TaxID=259390 RepID=UPI0002DC4196|nr:acyl-CoA thioesterase domain-containing protein [Nocardia takedensis]
METESFFTQAAPEVWEPTPWTRSPWGPTTQHAGPTSGLLVRALENARPSEEFRVARVGIDMLSPLPLLPVRVEVRVVRPGKRVTLLEATASVQDRVCLVARGWLLRRVDESFPVVDEPAAPSAVRPVAQEIDLPGAFMDGYMSANEWFFESGGFGEFGPARAWARPRVALVPGETPSGWQRTLIVGDSTYGVSLTYHPLKFPLINTDLTVVLDRDPDPDWISLDAVTSVVAGGGASARAAIGDHRGPAGVLTQTMLASVA